MQALYYLYENKCRRKNLELSRVEKIREYPETVLTNNCFKRKKGSCREKVIDQKFIQVTLQLASVTKKPKMFSAATAAKSLQ